MYENKGINTWGLVRGKSNIRTWEGFEKDDIVIFVPTESNLIITKILSTTQNKDLAVDLWGVDNEGQTWELIFFVREIGLFEMNKREFLRKLGYTNKRDYLMGTRKVTDKFFDTYISLEKFIDSNFEQKVTMGSLTQTTVEHIIEKSWPKKTSVEDKLKKLREILKKSDPTSDEYVEVNGKRIKRNRTVVAYVKLRDGYKCIACGFTLTKKDGTKYIEAAHIIPRSSNGNDTMGPDTSENMVALCPNCHKKLDLGDYNTRNEVLQAIHFNQSP